MAHGMLNVDRHGKYDIVATIHDEILAECVKGQENVEEFCSLMSDAPEWANGIPVKAAGWAGKRYRK